MSMIVDSENRGTSIEAIASIGAWCRTRNVRLKIDWKLNKRAKDVTRSRWSEMGGYFVITAWGKRARDGKTIKIQQKDVSLQWALGIIVDTLNDVLWMRPDRDSPDVNLSKFRGKEIPYEGKR